MELEALPIDVRQARIIAEVEGRMDLGALAANRQQEENDRRLLIEALATVADRSA